MGNILSDIFAGGTEGLLKGVKDVVSAFKADPLELARIEIELQKAQNQIDLALVQAQTHINEIEAAHDDPFVSRWRPFVGWVGGIGFAYAVLIQPMFSWLSLNAGLASPPTLDISVLMPVLTGLLGLAGMRTYEKFKGVA